MRVCYSCKHDVISLYNACLFILANVNGIAVVRMEKNLYICGAIEIDNCLY